MEVQEYCDSMATELEGWKAKIYDVMMKLYRLQSAERQRYAPQINELNQLIDDISRRIEQLKRECPSDWKVNEERIKEDLAHMEEIMEDVWTPLSVGK